MEDATVTVSRTDGVATVALTRPATALSDRIAQARTDRVGAVGSAGRGRERAARP